eukprot:TRINITY_DN743_c1_g2_i1.p1 TRINITY_DN743_c1_g2~~TRINITY_DN743_c1_g2_i1.p1  ORF type:complete len:234 (+),score=90.36 TRINITY_DN743_c1_g2_i1:257-958(+)
MANVEVRKAELDGRILDFEKNVQNQNQQFLEKQRSHAEAEMKVRQREKNLQAAEEDLAKRKAEFHEQLQKGWMDQAIAPTDLWNDKSARTNTSSSTEVKNQQQHQQPHQSQTHNVKPISTSKNTNMTNPRPANNTAMNGHHHPTQGRMQNPHFATQTQTSQQQQQQQKQKQQYQRRAHQPFGPGSALPSRPMSHKSHPMPMQQQQQHPPSSRTIPTTAVSSDIAQRLSKLMEQ